MRRNKFIYSIGACYDRSMININILSCILYEIDLFLVVFKFFNFLSGELYQLINIHVFTKTISISICLIIHQFW